MIYGTLYSILISKTLIHDIYYIHFIKTRKSFYFRMQKNESDNEIVDNLLEETYSTKCKKRAYRPRQPRSPKRRRRSYSSSSRSSRRSRSSSSRGSPSYSSRSSPWQRCVIATLLPSDAKRKEIKAFFSTVGKVEKIQMVFCLKTHQFLKKAYVYFGNVESVLLVSRYF